MSIKIVIRVAVLTALNLTACQTVTHGVRENIEIKTVAANKPLSGASCLIKQGNKKWSVTTPAKLEIPRGKEDLHITCSKAGYRMPQSEADIKADCSLLGSAGGGALGGAATGAAVAGTALAPALLIPGAGWVIWPLAVGGGALVGGAVSSGTDAANGAAYSYKSPVIIPMIALTPSPNPAANGECEPAPSPTSGSATGKPAATHP